MAQAAAGDFFAVLASGRTSPSITRSNSQIVDRTGLARGTVSSVLQRLKRLEAWKARKSVSNPNRHSAERESTTASIRAPFTTYGFRRQVLDGLILGDRSAY
jgi:hypothetical protein